MKEVITIKTLTIIGNGFDLGHELPTRFDNFIDSNPELYKEKYAIFRNGNNSWNEIECRYKDLLSDKILERNWVDIAEEVERIVGEYGVTEYGEVNFFGYESEAWDDEFNEIMGMIKLLEEFEKDFQNYLKEACNDEEIMKIKPRCAISEILHNSDTIISFNYTHTIELVYGINSIFHIHGDIDDSIAIGSGSLDELKESLVDAEYPTIKMFTPNKYGLEERLFYYEEDGDGNRVERHCIKCFFDKVTEAASDKETEVLSLLDKKSKDSLISRKQIIEMLQAEHYDKVYIIGHSLAEADYTVFDAINKDAEVTCSFFNEIDRLDKEDQLRILKLKHKYIQDSELY